MKRRLSYILALLALVVVLVPSCKKDEARVIPRAKLARIYAEMLVTDQWIQTTPKVRNIADTSLVYDPILEKYGYTSEDYRYSVMHYMNDPERFSRILRTSAQILDGEILALKKEQEEMLRRKRIMSAVEVRDVIMFCGQLPDRSAVDWSDSLRVKWDTLGNMFTLVRESRADTVYDGVRMLLPADTLAVADTLALTDTLASADTSKAAEALKGFRPLKRNFKRK